MSLDEGSSSLTQHAHTPAPTPGHAHAHLHEGGDIAGKRCVRPAPHHKKPPSAFKPQYTLNEADKAALHTFRQRLHDLTPAQQSFCDDPCLCRYLRAREWNVEAAEKLLRGTLAWRREFGVDYITPDTILEESRTGKLYFHGFDKRHRPVMYQRPRRQNTKDYRNQVRQVVYFLEREISCMDPEKGVEQHVLFIDFKDYSIWNAPPMSVTKEVMTILLDHYPERLGSAFLIDAPMLFNMAWKVLRPFVPKATQDKVHFVSRHGSGKMDKVLAEYFEEHQLEEEYGGSLPSEYDCDEYFHAERAFFTEWKSHASSHASPHTAAAAAVHACASSGTHLDSV